MSIVIRKFNDAETLGDALRSLRLSVPRTLSEMVKATKIQKKVLDAFEQNDFDRLPPSSYARRFLKTYVRALGGDENYFLQRYDEERGDSDVIRVEGLLPQRVRNVWKLTGMSAAKAAGFALASLAVAGYLGVEVRNVTAPPRLDVTFPADGYVTQDAVIHLRGTADPKASVEVNGAEVFTHPDGSFDADVALQRGLNVVTVEGAKRYSRPAETHRRIVLEETTQNALGNPPKLNAN